jgi:hypothetical protein
MLLRYKIVDSTIPYDDFTIILSNKSAAAIDWSCQIKVLLLLIDKELNKSAAAIDW